MPINLFQIEAGICSIQIILIPDNSKPAILVDFN